MLREMTDREFLEWKAFDQIEPIGDLRGDLQAGQIAATIMNALLMQTGKWEEDKQFKAEYFIPDLDYTHPRNRKKKGPKVEAPGQEKWRQWKILARMSAAAANADEKRKKDRAEKVAKGRVHAVKRAEEKAAKRKQEADAKAKARAERSRPTAKR